MKKLAIMVGAVTYVLTYHCIVVAQELDAAKSFAIAGFSVALPQGWEQREWTNGGAVFVRATAPSTRNDTAPSEIRLISSKPDDAAVALEETYKNFSANEPSTKNKQSYKLGTLIGYRSDSEKPVGPEKTHVLRLLLRDDARVYTLQFSVDNRDYQKTLPLIEKVISSFKPLAANK